MTTALTANVAGHRAKYETLKASMPIEEVGIAFVGGGDPVLVGFLEMQILRSLKNLTGASVVDIGCGIGRLSKYLVPLDLKYYLGLDIIPEILEEAIQSAKHHPNFEFVIAKDCNLPSPAVTFDIACGFSLITHLIDEEIFDYFVEAHRVLRPDGVAVFSFMDFDLPAHRASFYEHAKVHRQGHGDLLRFTTKPVLRYIAEGAGFSKFSFMDGTDKLAAPGEVTTLLDGRSAPASGLVYGQSVIVMRR